MNTRLLGILCIAGSLIAAAGALFFQFQFLDTDPPMGKVVGLLWAIGAIAGLIGLILSNGVGSNPAVRAVASLPIIALTLNTVGNIAGAAGVVSPDSVLFTFGFIGMMIGMVLVGILTIAAKTWPGWRRFVPLFIILVMIISGATGFDNNFGRALSTGVWVLLGYAVATAADAPSAAQSATA